MLGAGTHKVVWDGDDDQGQSVSSGLYLYRLSAPDFVKTRKMMLVK
jgi:flagellar hook assembly protein FlgD